jgi:tetratricopeptide (TPR) repeat protein
MDLLVGLPLQNGAESTVALRNTGAIDATVAVEAVTASGERLKADTTIRAANYGEITFKTPAKITRVEIDTDKLYPQTEYSDDVAPKELSESDPLLAVKKLFDKQDYAGAQAAAQTVLRRYPRYDEVRVLLARSLLGQNRDAEAATEFKSVVDEKLPTARSLAWANEGLGEIAAKANQSAQAAKYAEAAIQADAEYGASLAARNLRNRVNGTTAIDADIKDFFARFDKAAVTNRKADVDPLVVPGEVSKFASSVAGSTQQWTTQVKQVDKLDSNTALVETNLTIQLLNREPESGMAVFRMIKTAGGWKLAGVDMFEVR